MRGTPILMLVGLAAASTACGDEGGVTGAGPLPAPPAAPASDDEDGEAGSRRVIVGGDFDGYEWEFVMEGHDAVVEGDGAMGPCLAVRGEPLPQEGGQLSAGSCMGPVEELRWVSTTAAVGTVVFGHAPAETATVEFRDGTGGSTVVSALYIHDRFPDVRFFIERVGDGAAPVEVAALDEAGNVLRTQPLLSDEAVDSNQPLTDDVPG